MEIFGFQQILVLIVNANSVVPGDGLIGKQVASGFLLDQYVDQKVTKEMISSTVPGPQGPHGADGIAGTAEVPSRKQGTGIKIKGTVATNMQVFCLILEIQMVMHIFV